MDWDAEGLLEGLEDEEAKADRRRLLDELHEQGVAVDELRRACEEDRLVLLPVERKLVGDARYTAAEMAERTGLSVEWIQRRARAIGLAVPSADEPAFTDADVADADRSRFLRESGVSEDDLLEVERILGQGMARYAEAFRLLFAQGFLQPGDSEGEVARRYAAAADALKPIAGDHFAHIYFLHMRELVRGDVITAEERRSGRIEGRAETAVAFADLVGFTELGESVEAEELGGLAQRLTDLAEEAGRGPVRLVKTIGDAVMLVAPEPAPLLDATLEMVESAEGEGLPPLRAGLAFGPAVNRWGDWYGSTVNLASRLCSRARPRSVLIPADLRDHLGDAAERYTFSQAGQKRLKGVASPVPTLRVRPAGPLL